jgi:hypothetical protein
VTISLYTSYVVTAGAVLYADCSVATGADTHVEEFANVCYKNKKGVAEGVVLEGIALEGIIYRKDKEGEQRRKEVITSLVRVELRRFRRNTVIISLSLTSVFISLSFV